MDLVRAFALRSGGGWAFAALVAVVALAEAVPASAGDLDPALFDPTPANPGFSLVDELRLGAFDHNFVNDEGSPFDVSFEALSSPLRLYASANPVVSGFLNPRLAFGAMINTGGRTSYAFTTLNWRIPIYSSFFFEGEFGGAANDSPREREPDRVNIGCPVTFRESGGFGYQLTANVDVVANVEHVSHADLCGKVNPGITDFGVRIGYKF